MRRRRSSATRVAVVVESSPLIDLPLLRLEPDRLDELFVAYRVGAQQRVELLGRARHDIGPHRHELLADVGLPERLDDVAVELVEDRVAYLRARADAAPRRRGVALHARLLQ